jgi:alanine dehydrogenase
MRIAVPAEIQDGELRVALTPEGARRLCQAGHEPVVESGAGLGSGFADEDYVGAGAAVVEGHAEAYAAGEPVVKVKQLSPEEHDLLGEGSALFSYMHPETRPEMVRALLERKVTAIAFERVRLADGSLPLLAPMSRIAGHMAVLIGAQLLQTVHGGPGVMLGEAPGAGSTPVVVIGGGTVGSSAARTAHALGAEVTVFEVSEARRQALQASLPEVSVLDPAPELVADAVLDAWLVVNGATVPQDADIHVVTREMVRSMHQGSVIVDVTADLRGAIETSVRKTTHSDPTFVEEGVVHYVVPNIPGAVPRTSTRALAAASLPYILELAERGIEGALADNAALGGALLCAGGEPVAQDIAEML